MAVLTRALGMLEQAVARQGQGAAARGLRSGDGTVRGPGDLMALRIDPDHRRFRDIVRGKIKQDLRKYISQGELIGRKGKDLVSIPLPQIDWPHFRFGSKERGGVGQGEGDVGDSLGKGDPNADGTRQGGRSGGRARARGRAVARGAGPDPGRGAAAPPHRAQGQAADHRPEGQVRRHPPQRPRVAAPLQAHLPAGAAAADRDRHLRPERARSSSRCARTAATGPGGRRRCRSPTRSSST